MTTYDPQTNPLVAQRGKILEAFTFLQSVGIKVSGVLDQYEQDHAEALREPSEADYTFPFKPPLHIGDHLSMGGGRPILDSGLYVGRSYSLSPGQRQTLRDWYDLTPSQTVQVIGFSLFPDGKCIRQVRLECNIHITEVQRRKHLLLAVTIDHWGVFCRQASQRDAELAEARTTRTADTTTTVSKPRKPKTASMEDLMAEYMVQVVPR